MTASVITGGLFVVGTHTGVNRSVDEEREVANKHAHCVIIARMNSRLFRSAYVCSLLFPASLLAQTAISGVTVEPRKPELGYGFSFLDGEVRHSCLAKFLKGDPVNGASVSQDIQLFTSSESARKTVQTNAALTFGLGIFRSHGSFSSSNTVFDSSYSLYLVVSVEQVVGTVSLGLPDGKCDLQRRVPRDASKFFDRCGDAVFTAAERGGKYEAVLRIDTQSSYSHHELEASLSVGGLNLGDASLATKVSEAISKANGRVTASQNISGVIVPIPDTTPKAIIEFAQQFPLKVAAQPERNATSTFQFTSYSHLGCRTDEAARVEPAAKFLQDLADKYIKVKSAMADLTYVASHPDQFSPRFLVPANALEGLKRADNALQQSARGCARDSRNCSRAPSIPTIERMPELLLWLPAPGSSVGAFDGFVQSEAYTNVGVVPENTTRVLEARGTWYCGGPRSEKRCPQQAESSGGSVDYRIVDRTGNVVETGRIHSGMVTLNHAGAVQVRVADAPSQFGDNYADANHPVQVAVW